MKCTVNVGDDGLKNDEDDILFCLTFHKISGKPGGKGFYGAQKKHLVDNIGIIKPCKISGWERMLEMHNKEYTDKNWDVA
eukprot:15361251-Ditylum_brightwellii.AAC.1